MHAFIHKFYSAKDMGIFKFFKGTLVKTSLINTYSSMSSSTDGIRHYKACKFFHKRYNDGCHEIEIKVKSGSPMKFRLLSKPQSIGPDIMMFSLGSEDGRIHGIELMLKSSSAYLQFPDDTIINFNK